MDSKAWVVFSLIQALALPIRNPEVKPGIFSFPLVVRLDVMSVNLRQRAFAMASGLGTSSRPLKGILSSTGNSTKWAYSSRVGRSR